jgi:hypothetical protein
MTCRSGQYKFDSFKEHHGYLLQLFWVKRRDCTVIVVQSVIQEWYLKNNVRYKEVRVG